MVDKILTHDYHVTEYLMWYCTYYVVWYVCTHILCGVRVMSVCVCMYAGVVIYCHCIHQCFKDEMAMSLI